MTEAPKPIAVDASPDTVEGRTNDGSGDVTAGQRLRAARLAHGLTTADAALRLKLSTRQVEALEAEDWSALPERTFTRGFFRNYARLVGVDPDSLDLDRSAPEVASERVLADPPTLGRTDIGSDDPAQPSKRKRSAWTIPVALALILIAGAAYLHWAGPESPAKRSARDSSPPSSAATERRAAHSDRLSAQASGTAQNPTAAPDRTAGESSAGSPVAATPALRTTDGGLPAAGATAASTVPAMAASPAGEGQARLRFTFTGKSWTEVRSRGEVVFSETASPGVREFTAARPLSFVIGNASAVRLDIDGRPHDFANSTRNDVARFQIP